MPFVLPFYICIFFCVPFLQVGDNKISLALFNAGIVICRLGQWQFDLSANQQIQEGVCALTPCCILNTLTCICSWVWIKLLILASLSLVSLHV
jgi:hypothetical protein